MNSISVVKGGCIAGEFGVNSMHDITDGGGILVIDNIEKDVLPSTRDELFSI
ncbi:hypothetical protein LGK95_05090 [Clostridium algoriphilum]|uniref:hypothetical protein n=1 Tax=Clostridium algoriphilum TaxID=198347 RepID=UPI001CF26052|nr:hypothetical protein [Clostridium algoriphilum]MCB2292914.1 hypothetical protein [Clostridium algoriphilum]